MQKLSIQTTMIEAAEANLRALLDRVQGGEEILIVRDGVPIARLTSPNQSNGHVAAQRNGKKLGQRSTKTQQTSSRQPPLSSNPIVALNQRLARRIRREGKKANSKYANKFVGLVSGEIVVVADSLGEVATRLRKLERDNTKCYIVDVAADYNRAYEV